MFNFLKISIITMFVSMSVYATSDAVVNKLVNEATQYCKDMGETQCFKVFNDKNGKFTKGALYIFVIRYDGVIRAHGSNVKLIGKNLMKVKDAAGNMLIQELISIAKNKGEGWFDYKWSHPKTKKTAPKRSFVKAIGNNSLIGSGYYK